MKLLRDIFSKNVSLRTYKPHQSSFFSVSIEKLDAIRLNYRDYKIIKNVSMSLLNWLIYSVDSEIYSNA